MLNIEIDGKKMQVEAGSMVIEAADAAGIYIPRFCYHRKLSVAANCRMCLVDVEKVAKPVPACATPVTEGMRISTRSQKTLDAQKGVMEFLLINHPLDCPICDQGGECDLQDLAVGYGKDVGRYTENKRIVKDKDLGPLIATDMTRCIHCTRCVRFGEELAGLMELGATGRGEHMRIGTYVERSVTSELSGNMIDLCPVGALTSKPFRYSARPWELIDVPGVSPHDCVGTNTTVQVRRNKVMRVLPRENEALNEVWLSDRDRFSYEALDSNDRATVPMIKQNGEWRETDWQTALQFAADGLRKVVSTHGADMLGALAAPQATLEEFFLLQKLMRGLGSGNVDHRLRQRDFSDDDIAPAFPALELPIAQLEEVDRALLIGANIRKEQPLLGLRLRKAFSDGAQIAAVNAVDYEFTFDVRHKAIVSPAQLAASCARIAVAAGAKAGRTIPDALKALAGGEASAQEHAIADMLGGGERKVVLLGALALNHPQAATLKAIAEHLAEWTGAKLGWLAPANSAAGHLAGCLPARDAASAKASRAGLNAAHMLAEPRKGYLLLSVEPEVDCADGATARKAMTEADFVVAIHAFKSGVTEFAHVLLPAAAFTETSGTYVNCEGRWQSIPAAAKPLGDSRPAWKILRVLGNLLKVAGFDYTSAEEIRDQVGGRDLAPSARGRGARFGAATASGKLTRIEELPIYRVDALTRRSAPLLNTADNPAPVVRLHPRDAQTLGLDDNARVRVRMGAGEAVLPIVLDARVSEGGVWIPAGYAETARLGIGDVELARA